MEQAKHAAKEKVTRVAMATLKVSAFELMDGSGQ